MATSGAYYNNAFTFNYSFVDSADPTLLFTGTLNNTDITVYKRTGGTTVSPGTLTTSVPAGSGGVYTITVTAGEMQCDEVVLVCAATGMVKESIAITTEPTPSDVLEVQKTAVSGIADFRATGFSTFDHTTNQVIVATNNDKTGYTINGTLQTLDALDTQQDLQHSTTQSAISALNNFNPASDQVIVATNNDKTGYSITGTLTTLDALDTAQDIQHATTQSAISGLNDIAATDIVSAGPITTLSGAVVNVDLVDVTTTNTDMRGTDGAYTGTPPTVGQIADQVWDESYSAHNIAGSFGKLMDVIRKANLSTEGTVAGTPTASAFNTNLTQANDTFNDQLILFVSGSLTGVSAPILDYAQTNGRITLEESLPATPTASDEFVILPDHVHPITEIQNGLATSAALATVDANVDSILADTSTDGVVISTAQAQAIADEVLKRSVGNVEGATLSEHSLATIVLAILESQRVGSTWSIYRTDGTTVQASKTLTLDPSAEPVTRVQ